jgi:lauroyl/myristoyl acyltransferase
MADVFIERNNCNSVFLDRNCNISLFPARLAKIAGVPVVAVVPELRQGTIQIFDGPRFHFKNTNVDPLMVMQRLMSFFEKEIRRNPSIWSVFVRGSLSAYR